MTCTSLSIRKPIRLLLLVLLLSCLQRSCHGQQQQSIRGFSTGNDELNIDDDDASLAAAINELNYAAGGGSAIEDTVETDTVIEYIRTPDGGETEVRIRRLQEFVEYDYTMRVFFTWPDDYVFNGESLNAQIRNVVRVSQIFYRRIMADRYPLSYQQVLCTFITGQGDETRVPLMAELDFYTVVTFRTSGDVPNPSMAFAEITNFDRNDYLDHFIRTESPPTLFAFVAEVQIFTNRNPTTSPSALPTYRPSVSPSLRPSSSPSDFPSANPSLAPSSGSNAPSVSKMPTPTPTGSQLPSMSPSKMPTMIPSATPSCPPSMVPSSTPSSSPSVSKQPSMMPSISPSDAPSQLPSNMPSQCPSTFPSMTPTSTSMMPSSTPSNQPSQLPSSSPSDVPSMTPSDVPSATPSTVPSETPSTTPSDVPSETPSMSPSIFNSGDVVVVGSPIGAIQMRVTFPDGTGITTILPPEVQKAMREALVDHYNANLILPTSGVSNTFQANSASEEPLMFIRGVTSEEYLLLEIITTRYSYYGDSKEVPTPRRVAGAMNRFKSDTASILNAIRAIDCCKEFPMSAAASVTLNYDDVL